MKHEKEKKAFSELSAKVKKKLEDDKTKMELAHTIINNLNTNIATLYSKLNDIRDQITKLHAVEEKDKDTNKIKELMTDVQDILLQINNIHKQKINYMSKYPVLRPPKLGRYTIKYTNLMPDKDILLKYTYDTCQFT